MSEATCGRPSPDVAALIRATCCLRGGRSSRLAVSLLHCFCAGRDRLDDVVVARATTEVAFELVSDGAVVEIVALAIDHVDGGHDHAGRAVAALEAMMLAEGFVHGMQRAVGVGQ